MNSQVFGSLESGKNAYIGERVDSAGKQGAAVAESVDKFFHEHPYMTAAAGAVAVVGVFALTRGKLAALSADVLSPVAKSTLPEVDLLGHAGRALSARKAPLAVLSKGTLPEAGQIVARRAVGFASSTGESPVTGMALKARDFGGDMTKSRRIGFAAVEGAPANSTVGSAQALGRAAESEGAARPIAVYINTGERAFIDMNKTGPLQYAKLDSARISAMRPAHYREGAVIGSADPGAYGFMSLETPTPEVTRNSTFLKKLNSIIGPEHVATQSFRVSPELKSPAAVLDHEGFISTLLIPPGITKAQLSESIGAARVARHVLTHEPAQAASFMVQRRAVGFAPGMVNARAESMQDMMVHALKGSSEWVNGSRGNAFTQYLRDWHGNFTPSDKLNLHSLFTNQRVRLRDIPGLAD